jgi:UDP-N-acetylmuramoylalanine--D-glutamate ligase
VLYDGSGDRVGEVCDLLRARALPGRHNWQNAAAAYAAVRALGVTTQDAADGLMSFPGLAHRMELVGQIDGVRFVNDSKATNADAARAAMSAYRRFFWIAGGVAKAGGVESLADLFPRVDKAYLIGEAAPDFARTLEGKAPVVMSGDLETAVTDAFADAHAAAVASGEEQVVLLSPACASFDQFADFEQRGDAFRQSVHTLAAPASRGATG